ncbi:MAG: SurA N-terminal domain-containing protein [Flavobacteriales bacterium]
MVSLENIRNRSGLLLFVIGIAMLAFLLTDLMSSQGGGGMATDMVVGEIGSQEIDYQNFEQRVQESIDNQRRSNPNIDVTQVRNSVWNQMLRETIMKQEFSDLGLEVSAAEIFDMVQGENPYPTVQQAFANPETGEFDRARLLQFLKEDINNDETGQAKQQWINFEKAIRDERQTNKYNALVSGGLTVSDWEAKMDKYYQSEIRNVSYVQIPLTTIPDSLVNLTDTDLRSFITENSEQYQQEASREIEYVVYSVLPSVDDQKAANDWMIDVKKDFSENDNDELFIRKNSDVFNRVLYVSESDLDENIQGLVSSENGTVLGPYTQSRNLLRLAKLVDASFRPDSVEARHILISGPNAETTIDSLKILINQGKSFANLAEQFSEDQGSAVKGGDLGWFAEGVMVPEFNEACFTSAKNELSIVTSQFGTHLIQLTNKSKSSKKYKVAFLDRQILYSNTTYQNVFAQAGKFAAENSNYEQFNESAINENLSKRVADGLLETTTNIAGLENPRELVRWAYESNVGDISDVFEFGNKIVVASLTSIKKEGLTDLEDVRATIEPIVLNNKKSEMLLDELANVQTLDEVATSFGLTISKSDGVNFSTNQVPGLGSEPSFVGATFALEQGQTSSAFRTSKAVCVVQLDKVIEGAMSDNFLSNKNSLESSLQSRSTFQVYQALQDLVDIKDNRANFY